MNESMFYCDQQILSYKRLYNLIVGVRGHGKTYNCVRRCIECGLKNKRMSFVVLVRYKEDIKDIKDGWWNGCDVETLFPEWKFSCVGKDIYAQNELEKICIGQYVAITEYARAKRVPRPYVKYIFFDEFLNEDNDYLPNEISKFLSICDSVIRNRNDVRVFLVSNHITILNPYFDHFGFTKLNQRFTKGNNDAILEFTDSDEFVKFRETTKFGASIKDTTYGNFALNGQFMLDDETNVMKRPTGRVNFLFNLSLDGINIKVSMVNNILYLEKDYDGTRKKYTPYVLDAKTNGAIFCEKTFRLFKVVNKYFLNDRIAYDDLKTKNSVILFIQFLMGNRYK